MALLVAGCHATPAPAPEAAKKVVKKLSKAERKKRDAEKQAAATPVEPEKFNVPFAWEAEKEEPLALTRLFLGDALDDNDAYMQRGAKFFADFADKQTPRATVITCADSRVQPQAWDATPENDDFTIRDIGNQIENVEGSVEYGVEHLNTPLLLVIGHTGCGAVKAAMEDTSKLSEPIRKELEHLHPPVPKPGKKPDEAWAEAVVSNVNDQVRFSLLHFSSRVHEGKLTVVGAVYDFRNDLGQGAGKLVIVNVNGISDAERLSSFNEAVRAGRGEKPAGSAKEKKSAGAKHETARTSTGGDPVAELSRIVGGKASAHGQGAEAVVATSDVTHEAHGGEH
ncbi:MAG: carbonic anhydrase [Polyangiaceae bacterium]